MSLKVIAVILLFAASLGGAVSMALLEGGIEYRSVGHLTSDAYGGQRVKVKGEVQDIEKGFKPALFVCTDIPAEGEQLAPNAPRMRVIYEGDDVPQNLKRKAHVTLEGRFDPERGMFVATLVQTQCPSRYEGKELTTADGGTASVGQP